MPHATDGAISKNMGTQCENIDVENQKTVRTSGLRKYFGLGLHTSDPLLNVLKWIVYFTEVPCFHVRDVVVTSFLHRLVQLSLWLSPISFFCFFFCGGVFSTLMLVHSSSLHSCPSMVDLWVGATSTLCGSNHQDTYFSASNR